MILYAGIWPCVAWRPSMALAITYEPPLRPVRKAPPSLRAASLNEQQTAELIRLVDTLSTSTEDRR